MTEVLWKSIVREMAQKETKILFDLAKAKYGEKIPKEVLVGLRQILNRYKAQYPVRTDKRKLFL